MIYLLIGHVQLNGIDLLECITEVFDAPSLSTFNSTSFFVGNLLKARVRLQLM